LDSIGSINRIFITVFYILREKDAAEKEEMKNRVSELMRRSFQAIF
jgi:hypothetical protein